MFSLCSHDKCDLQLLLTGLGHVDFGFPDPVTVSIKMISLLKMRWGWENKRLYIRPRSVLRMSDGQVARRVRSGDGVVGLQQKC